MRRAVAAVLLLVLALLLAACNKPTSANRPGDDAAQKPSGSTADAAGSGPYASLVAEFCAPKGPPKFVKKHRLKSFVRQRSATEKKEDPDFESWNSKGEEIEDLRPSVSHSPKGKRWSLGVTVGWIAELQGCTPAEVRADFMKEHATHNGEFFDSSSNDSFPWHSGFYSYRTRWLDCTLAELKQGSDEERLSGAQISINCLY